MIMVLSVLLWFIFLAFLNRLFPAILPSPDQNLGQQIDC